MAPVDAYRDRTRTQTSQVLVERREVKLPPYVQIEQRSEIDGNLLPVYITGIRHGQGAIAG